MSVKAHTWTGAMDAALIKAYGAGVATNDIAKDFGVTVAIVTGRAFKLGCVHGIKLSPLQRASLAESRAAKNRLNQSYSDKRRDKHTYGHSLSHGGPDA